MKSHRKSKQGGTIPASECSTIKMTSGNEKKFDTVIDEKQKMHWVGFGWVNQGKATAEDFKKFKTVVR